MPFGVFNEVLPKLWLFVFDTTIDTSDQVLVTTEARDYRIDTLKATNTDSIAHVVRISYDFGTGHALLGSVSVPAGAGVGGVAATDLLPAALATSTAGLVLPAGTNLWVSVEVVVTGAEHVYVTALGGVF